MGRTVKGINICNIAFDGKYMDFIKKMRETFKDDIEYSKQCRDYKILSRIQDKYRDYVAYNQNQLTVIENKKFINQEYFAVLVSLILGNIESIDRFEDIFENYKKDFEVMYIGDYDVEQTSETSEVCSSHCCCGHSVHSYNTYYLTNLSTGYTLLIGCDCIEKYKIISLEELKELKAKRRFKERTKEGKCYFCGKKGKCKACKNIKIARNVFTGWRRVSIILKNSTKLLTTRIVAFQRKRLRRLLKGLIVKRTLHKSRVIAFQTKRLQRLLKPLVIKWKLLYMMKCSKCRKVMNTMKYDKCYTCFREDNNKCDDCGKMKPKNHPKCYNCKYKYKCKSCDSKMQTNKYENCYDCNVKKKRKYSDKCDHCQGTKRMYYCDDCWGECIFC